MEPFDFAWMIGQRVTQVTFSEPSLWLFSFDAHSGISTESPWRILEHGKIAISHEDHGQKYGLPEPIDAAALASSLLAGVEIKEVKVREGTADILISLAGDIHLEIIPFSSGYEGWQVSSPSGHQVIAQGGGQLCTWER
jgi:hypothetical protein